MRLLYLLPNLLTAGNLFCGSFSIYSAVQGRFLLSAHLIFVGMLFDFYDGKTARLTNTVSRFGTYLDSIADIMTFGIAPAFLTYTLCAPNLKSSLSFFLFLYALAGLFRLIRYTFFDAKVKRNEVFSGLPIPAAAGSLAGVMLVYIHTGMAFPSIFVLCVLILNAVLMISVLPYQHFSGLLKMFPPFAKVLLTIIFGAALLSGYYYAVLFMFFLLYTVFGIKWHLIYEGKGDANGSATIF